MTKFTDIELAVIAIILEEEEREVEKRKWVHACVNRERDGESVLCLRN
jgi:hypothetical protein